jgi:hypothetical protein
MYAGGVKQVLYKEYICWIQVKIHISDQTSLRICNSVVLDIMGSDIGEKTLLVPKSLFSKGRNLGFME